MSNPKLLVVDDEEDYASFVSNVAKSMDFDAISTDNSSDFLTLYNSNISVIVLDLFMPGTDGIQLLRFLKKSKSNAAIILISGGDKAVLYSAYEIAIEQGMVVLGVISKPFLVKELEDLLFKYTQYSPARKIVSIQQPSVNDIRSAIENEELFMVYQPQVAIANRKVLGVESHIRWNHPSRGMISPDVFIPIAEENNLMQEINSFVTNASIQQQSLWLKSDLKLQMSINISPRNLDDLRLPEKLASLANEGGISMKDITIEITETALMKDVILYIDILTRLKMKGFGLSIDDFGTGYSSLQQLVQAPFNKLKIDREFIKTINSDNECKIITEAAILLAHKLGMEVVAEGVEDEDAWNTLRELGCDAAQGPWIAKPMLPEEILAWKENW